MSQTIQEKIQEWRRKSAEGTMTIDDMREAIAAIRKERVQASEVSKKSRTKKADAKAKQEPVDSDDLLKELGI
jgi:lipopolysaccharide export system protein LptC